MWAQALLTFRSPCYGGAVLQEEVLKIRAMDVESKSFSSQGESGSYEFPCDCMLL